MNRIALISLSFISIIFSQSISDINRQVDRLKNELQDELKIDEIDSSVEDVSSNIEDIVISNSNANADIFNNYFGYNYFTSDINFFDNIPTPEDYRIGPGDEIILSLWGEQNLRTTFTINKSGLIYYENIGFINILNKTIDEAEEVLLNELSEIYETLTNEEKPTYLNLELGELKSINVYFTGQVISPGVNIIHPFSDVFSALTQAGGIKNEGSLRNVQIIRNSQMIASFDFYDFFMEGKNSFSKVRLLDGDVIHVPKVEKRVNISGEVTNPGYYEILKSDDLYNLIDYAAGLKPMASSIITIDTVTPLENRKSQDNILSSINIDLNNKEKVVLNNGDSIFVREIGDSDSKVEIFGRVKVPGEYSANETSLKNLLDYAGGFDDPEFRQTIRDDEIVILRRDAEQFYSKEFRVTYDDAESFKLNIGDKIFVYENPNYSNQMTYTISGEVDRPGTYPLRNGLTIANAIKQAGGVTANGSINSLSLLTNILTKDEFGNTIEEKEFVASLDFNFELNDGDLINILPKQDIVRVVGNVYSPGLVAHSNKRMTASDAIELAGGYKPYSMKRKAYVVRANGQVEKVNLFLGRAKRVYPGDSVFVPTNPNPKEFDFTSFLADFSSTLANIAAIIVIADKD